MPRLPLIEDLTAGPVPAGSNLLVEYDPTSQWHNTLATIAAGWLKTGGKVTYHIISQPRENVRSQLRRLGVNVDELEGRGLDGKLSLGDWYTASLGRMPEGEDAFTTLKVADLSINWAKSEKEVEMSGLVGAAGIKGPPWLRIMDNASFLSRFNDDKAWVEFYLTRFLPRGLRWKNVTIVGLIKGFHADWIYKTLEEAADGVLELKIEDTGNETRDFIRVRAMRAVGYDRKWHQLDIGENFEVTLKK